jgi:anti-sigma factor RsiW
MMTESRNTHEECWLLLPWLANGRLAAAERAAVEGHLRGCSACVTELERQQLIHSVLTEPERVTHAPGPSLRKLMERIDGAAPTSHRSERPAGRPHRMPAVLAATWRPPGLAWAATFVCLGVRMLAPPSTAGRSLRIRRTPAPHAHRRLCAHRLQRSLTVGGGEPAHIRCAPSSKSGPAASLVWLVAAIPVTGPW